VRAMRLLVAALFVVAGCGGKESKKQDSPAPSPGSHVASQPIQPPAPDAAPAPPKPITTDLPPPDGVDFTAVALALLAIGACGDAPMPNDVPAKLVEAHCAVIKKTQAEYADRWVVPARKFFAEKVPKDIPKKVVYPFAGGDLSTALTVFPDADEITTISLEPAGDPRSLDALTTSKPTPAKTAPSKAAPAPKGNAALAKALGTVRSELDFLYRVNFSNTMNMIDAMRGGALPTQLIFGLSALKVHGYEVVSLHYFKLDDEGTIKYLADDDVKKAPPIGAGTADHRNRIFANAELRFRKPNGRIQIYRHLQMNLDDEHMAKDTRVLAHLQAKGKISGMTKAAAYLLSWDSFSTMRRYMIDHVVWMVSDATGVPPKYGTPAGFEYETYGVFHGPHMNAGNQISKNWQDTFASQPKRELPFRFGYPDKQRGNTLVIMKPKS
jgi:hypothetical protein